MLKFFLFLSLILFGGCQTSKSTLSPEYSGDCPTEGICVVAVHEDKSLNILEDEFGAIYYTMVEKKESSVVHFKYDRNVDQQYVDGHYTEEILFEITNNTPLNLSDTALQETKMIFGRHCFCKGQAGYYKVTSGTLNLIKNKKGTQFTLDFKVKDVPQIITFIKT